MRKVLTKIDNCLGDERFASDIKAAGKIWLDIAKTLIAELDEVQLAAIEVASRYWRDEADEKERLQWLEKLCARMDKHLRDGQDNCRAATINRIAAASLMTTIGLTHEMGEFMDELAERLRIDENVLIEIFDRHVPGFAAA